MKVGWKKNRMSRKEELSDLLEKLSDKVGEILDACR